MPAGVATSVGARAVASTTSHCRFRFDVTLKPTRRPRPAPLGRWRAGVTAWTSTRFGDTFRRPAERTGYRTVPNRRVQIDTCLANRLRGESSVATAGELVAAAAATQVPVSIPRSCPRWRAISDTRWRSAVPRRSAAFDVLFRRPATVPDGDRPALVFDRTPPADGRWRD